MSVSLVFPAFNRLEFTRESWRALLANTDWDLVGEFHVYDDGSTDGTREFLQREFVEFQALMRGASMRFCFHETGFRSPMGVTIDWIRKSRSAEVLAKLDNDTVYPPGWLGIAMEVLETRPELDMLGLECMREPVLATKERRGYLPAEYISGLGLYRGRVFATGIPVDGGYFGFEEWMSAHCKNGWILPSIPTILLDRLPMEPWKSLSERYVHLGWQRPWSLELTYKAEQHEMWDWWTPCG